MDWLKGVIEAIKLKPKFLLAAGIVCLLITGAPGKVREYLEYDKIISHYRGWISLAGFVLTAYATIAMSGVWDHWRQWRLSRNAPQILEQLSSQEKGCLAEYIHRDASTLIYELGNGVVGGLVIKDVLYRPASIAVAGDRFAFNVQPWVMSAIITSPKLKEELLGFLGKGPREMSRF
jgi:hypothetical protein